MGRQLRMTSNVTSPTHPCEILSVVGRGGAGRGSVGSRDRRDTIRDDGCAAVHEVLKRCLSGFGGVGVPEKKKTDRSRVDAMKPIGFPLSAFRGPGARNAQVGSIAGRVPRVSWNSVGARRHDDIG